MFPLPSFIPLYTPVLHVHFHVKEFIGRIFKGAWYFEGDEKGNFISPYSWLKTYRRGRGGCSKALINQTSKPA